MSAKNVTKKKTPTYEGLRLTEIVKAIGGLQKWHHNCHAASLAIVRTGLLPKRARVARGWCTGVGSQHSWVAIGDPYDDNTVIVDATLWSYTDAAQHVVFGPMRIMPHRPHGYGDIWVDGGPPPVPTLPVIKLKGFSEEAKRFLALAAPQGLDRWGWAALCKSPHNGWPAKEIITKIAKNKALEHLVPIDIVGMATDLNPRKLYW